MRHQSGEGHVHREDRPFDLVQRIAVPVDGFDGVAGPRRELAPQFQLALVPRQRVPEELERPDRVRGRVGAVAAARTVNLAQGAGLAVGGLVCCGVALGYDYS